VLKDNKPGQPRHASEPVPIPRAATAASSSPWQTATHFSDPSDIEVGPGGAWKLRLLSPNDHEEVLRIQRACYPPEYRDDPQAYLDRMRIFPTGCVGIYVPRDLGGISSSPSTPPSPSEPSAQKKRKKEKEAEWLLAGYILVQPFYRGDVNDISDVKGIEKWLAAKSGKPKDANDCIYTHEIAVDPAFRGCGLAKPFVHYTDRLAREQGFPLLTLVALEDAVHFWKKAGYTVVRVLNYGGHSCYYMEKPTPRAP